MKTNEASNEISDILMNLKKKLKEILNSISKINDDFKLEIDFLIFCLNEIILNIHDEVLNKVGVNFKISQGGILEKIAHKNAQKESFDNVVEGKRIDENFSFILDLKTILLSRKMDFKTLNSIISMNLGEFAKISDFHNKLNEICSYNDKTNYQKENFRKSIDKFLTSMQLLYSKSNSKKNGMRIYLSKALKCIKNEIQGKKINSDHGSDNEENKNQNKNEIPDFSVFENSRDINKKLENFIKKFYDISFRGEKDKEIEDLATKLLYYLGNKETIQQDFKKFAEVN